MPDIKIGIDLGGTKVFVIVLDSNGKVLSRAKTKTEIELGIRGIGDSLYKSASKALKKAEKSWSDVETVGIAVPSSVDQATGTVLHAPNLGWKNEPAREIFEVIFDRAVFLENDVNCGTLAEARLGAGRGASTVVGFFLGTGIGGGIVFQNKLHTGLKGAAGELGHMIVRYRGRKCGCGNRGCLEAYCSKVAFGKRFDKLINHGKIKSILPDIMGNDFSKLKSGALAKAYRANDKVTCKVLNQGAYLLGVASASMMTALTPDCFVYGGGVLEALGDELFPHIEKGVEEHLFGLEITDVRLELSQLKDDAVAMGAAILAEANPF